MKSTNTNILLLWDRIGDYHAARWSNLSSSHFRGKVVLCAFGSKDNLYLWDKHSSVISLSNKGVDDHDLLNRINNFRRVLKEKNINEVFIPGYGRLEYLIFILISKAMGKRVYLFAESWYDRLWIKRLFKKVFLTYTIDGLFVSGKRAFHHFHNEIGLKSMPIVIGYSAIDNDHFNGKIKKKNIVLCVARYSPEKNLIRLINAFKKSELHKSFKLVLVGDGPQRNELERLVKGDKHIVLQGWVSYNELPKLYQSAKFFILPSTFEPWGLVVNEAMAAGLPVAVSNVSGCSVDLVNENVGYTFDPYSEDRIKEVLNNFNNLDDSAYEQKSQSSLKLVSEYSLHIWSERILQIIKKAC